MHFKTKDDSFVKDVVLHLLQYSSKYMLVLLHDKLSRVYKNIKIFFRCLSIQKLNILHWRYTTKLRESCPTLFHQKSEVQRQARHAAAAQTKRTDYQFVEPNLEETRGN